MAALCAPTRREEVSSAQPAVQAKKYRSLKAESTRRDAPSMSNRAHSPGFSPASAGCATFQTDPSEAFIFFQAYVFRRTVPCF